MASIQEFQLFCKNVKNLIPSWSFDPSNQPMVDAWFGPELESFSMEDFRTAYRYIRTNCTDISTYPNSAAALINICLTSTNKEPPKRDLLSEVLKLISSKSRDVRRWPNFDPVHAEFIQRMGGIDRLADAEEEQLVWIRKDAVTITEEIMKQISSGQLQIEKKQMALPDISDMIKDLSKSDKVTEEPPKPKGKIIPLWEDLKKELGIDLPMPEETLKEQILKSPPLVKGQHLRPPVLTDDPPF